MTVNIPWLPKMVISYEAPGGIQHFNISPCWFTYAYFFYNWVLQSNSHKLSLNVLLGSMNLSPETIYTPYCDLLLIYEN